MSRKVKRQVSIFQVCERTNTNVLWIWNCRENYNWAAGWRCCTQQMSALFSVKLLHGWHL